VATVPEGGEGRVDTRPGQGRRHQIGEGGDIALRQQTQQLDRDRPVEDRHDDRDLGGDVGDGQRVTQGRDVIVEKHRDPLGACGHRGAQFLVAGFGEVLDAVPIFTQ
jgi:hypothetical protein